MSDTTSQRIKPFVRKDMLPEQSPPATQSGVIKWSRDNLFSSTSNSVLTVLSFVAIYYICVSSAPWLFNGVWASSSIRECREILEGATGGCFAVLTERWNQLLFGFTYPDDQYWRPTLAFVLLLAAAAPVMFFKYLPSKLLFFTAIYPFLAYYLIWGGPILTPVFALLGFVAGYVAWSRLVNRSFAFGFFGAIAAAVITWTIGGAITEIVAPEETLMYAVPSRDMGGFMLNLILGTVCV
ncbi:MAG: amino acid ABC transporter permease, partial [Pseudomonadota bacterium]